MYNVKSDAIGELPLSSHNTEKPNIFISHASSDGEFARVIQEEIERVFANDINVFCTSSSNSIALGKDWLAEIESNLSKAQAIIVIVTPISIEKPWLWFEVGATWLKGRSGQCVIYPLCVAEVELKDLPAPLNRLQALSMSKGTDLKIFFEQLIQLFGFGNLKSLRTSNITTRIPKYNKVHKQTVDIEERSLYSGVYSGYSDEELMEVLDTGLLYTSDDIFWRSSREENIRYGKLIHFRGVDQQLGLPFGTAKRLLVKTAERYDLEPEKLTDNTVRFKKK